MPEIGVMIQNKVRKKKRPTSMIILKGVYPWNKMWSLKSLAMLKCDCRNSLHAVQYK